MTEFVTRLFRGNDSDAVMDIWLQGNKQAHPFVPAAYWDSHASAVEGALPHADVRVCEMHGEVVGFIGLSGEHVEGLFVKDAARSRGVGKALLDWAKSRHGRLTLCVYVSNERAVKFYLREGFAVAQTRIDEDTGCEEHLMEWGGMRRLEP